MIIPTFPWKSCKGRDQPFGGIGLAETFRASVLSSQATPPPVTTSCPTTCERRSPDNLAELDRKEDYFLELAAEDGWPKDGYAANSTPSATAVRASNAR